jgi:hypothetical protein
LDFTDNELLLHGESIYGVGRDSTYDGTNYGATTGQTGKIGNAWDFDGSNDLVSINPSISSYCDLSDCSVSAWINLDTIGTTTKAIIGSRDSGNGGEGWIFRVNSAGGRKYNSFN